MTYQNIKTTSVTITALPNKPVANVVLEAINYATDMNLPTDLYIDGQLYGIDPATLIHSVLSQHPTPEVPLVQNP